MLGSIINKVLTPGGIGFVAGIYTAQNYDIPDIKDTVDRIGEYLKEKEREMRKEE